MVKINSHRQGTAASVHSTHLTESVFVFLWWWVFEARSEKQTNKRTQMRCDICDICKCDVVWLMCHFRTLKIFLIHFCIFFFFKTFKVWKNFRDHDETSEVHSISFPSFEKHLPDINVYYLSSLLYVYVCHVHVFVCINWIPLYYIPLLHVTSVIRS